MKPLPDWNEIDTVLLDMDGTLLDLHFDNFFWLQHVPLRYAEKFELTQADAHEKLMGRYSEVSGSLDWYCVEFWSKELSLDIAKLKLEMSEKIAIRPEVIAFLSWLNHNDKRVVLVTNAHPVSLDIKMNKTGLHVHFDNIINSHEIGLAKEHAGFWHELQRFESYDMHRSMLIDDNHDVLASAHEYGIRYCLGISQPDSQGMRVESERFALIDNFQEILPAT